MTLVILAAALLALAALGGGWSHHRRRQLAGWEHELDEAFGAADREPLPRHRSLRPVATKGPRRQARAGRDHRATRGSRRQS